MNFSLAPVAILVLAPIGGLGANCICHGLLSRIGKPGKHLGPIILAFVFGLFAQIALTYSALNIAYGSVDEVLAYYVLNSGCYGALGYCYFTFVNLTATSLRIRILRALVNSPTGAVTAESLRKDYKTENVLDVRIERLQKWKQIQARQDRYYLLDKAAFFYLACVIREIKRFLLRKH